LEEEINLRKVQSDGIIYQSSTYPSPKDAASKIKGHLAFWKGIEITE